jgi:hypothetical protein
VISRPRPLVVRITTPLPNNKDPDNPKSQEIRSHFWQSTITDVGSGSYPFAFLIVNSKGKELGRYYWNLTVDIARR